MLGSLDLVEYPTVSWRAARHGHGGAMPTDPATFAIVSLVLLVAALTACFLPARRTMRVDPMAR